MANKPSNILGSEAPSGLVDHDFETKGQGLDSESIDAGYEDDSIMIPPKTSDVDLIVDRFKKQARENFKTDISGKITEDGWYEDDNIVIPPAELGANTPEMPASKVEHRPTAKSESWPVAPKVENKDLLTESGEILDFSRATSYPELIDMIRSQEYIVNGLKQKVPAETVINQIYKLTYQDLKNYKKEDWTSITLRHNLRGTVANLIRDYKKTDEFLAMAGLDLSGARTIEDIFSLLRQKQRVVDVNGNDIASDLAIKMIDQGRLDLLPTMIRYKVIEINRQNNLATATPSKPVSTKVSFGQKIKSGIAKLKFWGK